MADGSTSSLWIARADATFPQRWEPLDGPLAVDVAIIGGGIVGATAARRLAEAGRSVALLEANRIGNGATGNSTGKMTVHQGTNFASLERDLGAEDARRVLAEDRAAVEFVREVAAHVELQESAARSVWSWAYASTADGRRTLEDEAAAARRLGIATTWAGADLGFGTWALGVEGQLLVEPAMLCRAFARSAAALGAHVHEGTTVVDVDLDEVVMLRTDAGVEVRAGAVVLATHVPTLDRSLAFAGCTYRRSHAVALPVAADAAPATDMFTGIDPGALSARPAHDVDGSLLMVFAGRGHALDEDEDGSHLDALEAEARDRYRVGERHYGWITHDAFATDGRPLVGPMRGADNVHVATGFSGWGLARGVAAAHAIADHLLAPAGSEWSHPFDARRRGPLLHPKALLEGLHTVRVEVVDRLRAPGASAIEELRPGEGGVFRRGMHTVAAARDGDGTLHLRGAACTHLGCTVRFDAERACWQCPCHGSRFALDGAVLDGPATRPLPDASGVE